MAGPADNTFLIQAATYLGATAIMVPVFKRLKLGTILGFLAAGIALGPDGLGLLRQEEGVFHVAELGVVLFLFVIGLELSLGRLWSLRRTIFGLGLLQMLVTGLALGALFQLTGWLGAAAAYIAGFALACSSTAFVLSLLEERGELNSPYGTKSFSVLLFQDLAVIPLLAAIPIAALIEQGRTEQMAPDWQPIAVALGAVVGVIALGRFVLNPFFRLVAVSGSREAFTAAALFVVAGVSLIVSEAGLSMALGAFIAGVMLAESRFRHQIEADIEPFRELLLGLFFIGVGMQLDLGVLADAWWIVLLGTLGLMTFKAIVLYGLTRLFADEPSEPRRVAAVLCQGGEFAFVVFSLGVGRGLFAQDFATLASAVVTLSMMATPIIVALAARAGTRGPGGPTPDPAGADQGQVLLVGFGRFGQIIARVLLGARVPVTAIDKDPSRIAQAERFGFKVYFGDGTDVNLLLAAGALRAHAVVLAMRDGEKTLATVQALREHCPKVRILVRAYDRQGAIALMDSGADVIIRDTLESAILMAGETLNAVGLSDGMATEVIEEFRERDRDVLLQQKAKGLWEGRGDPNEPFQAARRERQEEADA